MPGDASLAKLFREYGDEWEIERVERATEWVASAATASSSTSSAPAISVRSATGWRRPSARKQRNADRASWSRGPLSTCI